MTRGLGKSQYIQRKQSKRLVYDYIIKNQPVCTNQIIKNCGIRSPNTVMEVLSSLLGHKKIKLVPDPKRRKNTKCYATMLYQDIFSSPMVNQNPFLNPKQFFKNASNTREKQLRQLVFAAMINPLLEQGYCFDLERFRLDTAIEEKRKIIKGKKRKGATYQQLKNIIIYSETTLTKNQACKKYGITTKNLTENIKRNYRLQDLRDLIREMFLQAEKSSKVIIPQENEAGAIDKLQIKTKKEAERLGLIWFF